MKRFEGLKQWLIRRTYFIGEIWFSDELKYMHQTEGEALMLWNKKCQDYYALSLVNMGLRADVDWLLTRSDSTTKALYRDKHAE